MKTKRPDTDENWVKRFLFTIDILLCTLYKKSTFNFY